MNIGRPNLAAANPARHDTPAAEIITSESSGRWAVALRRELGPAVVVHETRSVAECWETLAREPASFVVVEVTAGNLEALLSRLARREREFPRARVAVVADRRMAGYDWLMREAGAVAFVISPRRAAALAGLARRHLANQPDEPTGTTERIWNSLPWKEYATT